MSSAQTLRGLILAMWATSIAGGVLDLALESQLPTPLREYVEAQWEGDLGVRHGVGLVAGLAALWLLIQGSIELYRLREAGRRPFLIGSVLSILMMPLFGPVIYNGWSALSYEASLALDGVIVGWLFLSRVQLQLSDPASSKVAPGRPPPIG